MHLRAGMSELWRGVSAGGTHGLQATWDSASFCLCVCFDSVWLSKKLQSLLSSERIMSAQGKLSNIKSLYWALYQVAKATPLFPVLHCCFNHFNNTSNGFSPSYTHVHTN